MKDPSLKERISMIETHVVYIREGIDAIRDRLDKQNATLLNHEKRLTRLSTTQKIVIGLLSGSGATGGIAYGLLHWLGG